MASWDDVSIEESVISLITRNQVVFDNAIRAGLTEHDFIDQNIRSVFLKVKSLSENEIEINKDNLLHRLSKSERERWIRVFGEGPVTTKVGYYLEALRHHKFKSATLGQLKEVVESVRQHDPYEKLDQVVGKLHQSVLEISKAAKFRGNGQHVSDCFEQFMCSYDNDIATGKGGETSGIMTGFKMLDKYLGGFRPGGVYTVAARTGVGKTTLSCNFALSAAAQGKRVAFFTIEMTGEELTQKMISILAKVSVLKMSNRALDEQELDRVTSAGKKMAEMPIEIFDVNRSFHQIAASISSLKAMSDVDLVIIDYVQLLKIEGYQGPRNYELGEITAEIKALAKSNGVPIISIAQVGRGVDKQGGFDRPKLSDLKDSASIEMDSNHVIFIHEDSHRHELIVAKNRSGPKGSFNIKSDLKFNYMGD